MQSGLFSEYAITITPTTDHYHLNCSDVDCITTTRVRFQLPQQHDEAGLIVRLSEPCGLKTCMEFKPEGSSRLGTVMTNTGYSDWSCSRSRRVRSSSGLRIAPGRAG
ncbi:DUF1349 domain-containing protein [Sorangium sp. So ce118]